MEAALRTAYFLVTGKEMGNLEVSAVRGLKGTKEAQVQVDGVQLGVAVVNGLGNAARLLDQIRAGRQDLHFIEVMTCPGGCIGGGGQPWGTKQETLRARLGALYAIDANEPVRVSHKNPYVMKFYEEYLGQPLGEKSHHLLHTHYTRRESVV